METIDGDVGDFSFYEEDNDHEKTYVTVHADSFNEKDFNNFLNCLDTLRESENKRRGDKKVIKNYCVQVPYIDNSIMMRDDDCGAGEDFEKTCDEMKSNISQMFSYFDEDVKLNYDDYDKLNLDEKRLSKKNQAVIVGSELKSPTSESFQEKFLRNRRKIKEMTEVRAVDTKPIIRGVIKKPNAPNTPNNSLNRSQVDKIMSEFNRVKINYYSKQNYVEFTDIDYFYCDSSDIESVRSEKVGKLDQTMLSKFESQEIDDIDGKLGKKDIEIVPKNSVRDKINMFTNMDFLIQPCSGSLQKSMSAPNPFRTIQKQNETFQRHAAPKKVDIVVKNSSTAVKNLNKCFIKDINESLHGQVKIDNDVIEKATQTQDGRRITIDLLDKITSYAQLNDVTLLLALERIVNKFDMSLLHTIDGLMSDEAFTLVGKRMSHLNVETRPSIERFNETFNEAQIDMAEDGFELSVIGANNIQLKMRVNVVNQATMETSQVNVNVIFMARYKTDECLVPSICTGNAAENNFFILFTSLYEVLLSTVV